MNFGNTTKYKDYRSEGYESKLYTIEYAKKESKSTGKNKTGFYKAATKMNFIRDIFTNILY